MKRADKHWEKLGEQDPYYWVTTQNKYRSDVLTPEGMEEFFSEGDEYLKKLVQVIKNHLSPDFAPVRALDYGCGVGRILMSMGHLFESAVGTDISEPMLEKARLHAKEAGLDSLEIVKSDDQLSKIEGSFDFIHSIYVFQHIPNYRGYEIFRQLLEKLNPGGVAMIQIVYANDMSRKRHIMDFIKSHIPLALRIVNLLHLRSPGTPMMEMHNYSLSHLNRICHQMNVAQCYSRYTKDGPFRGAMMFIQKSTEENQPYVELTDVP